MRVNCDVCVCVGLSLSLCAMVCLLGPLLPLCQYLVMYSYFKGRHMRVSYGCCFHSLCQCLCAVGQQNTQRCPLEYFPQSACLLFILISSCPLRLSIFHIPFLACFIRFFANGDSHHQRPCGQTGMVPAVAAASSASGGELLAC